MEEAVEILKSGGWQLATGAAARHSGSSSPDFHAIYNGEVLDSPRRGVVAAIASSVGAWETAQIAVNGFAEGYFGAGDTLSPWRAAAISLASINTWLYRQSKSCAPGREMTASLSAVIFAGRRIDIVHVGVCRVYSCHDGQVMPLTTEHLRSGSEKTAPSRLLGADEAVHIDHFEVSVEAGDRFILLSAGGAEYFDTAVMNDALAGSLGPNEVARRIDLALAETGGPNATSVLVIDVVEPPRLAYDDIAARFADLPLRRPPHEGNLWDGFRIGRTINRSRYTLLKRAWDEIEKRDVVLKFPLASMLADQVFRAGFLREAWVGISVRANCVARYLELAPDRQTSLYLVMPYYRGETLEKRLLRSPRVSFAEGIGIALKLCTAVTELGKHDVIHRDIKPENVMLSTDGDVLLLDLGLAYLAGVDDPEEDRLGGTTRYMAPELFAGIPPDARSEVFSLGVTIYRMFAGGKFPFGQRERRPLSRLRSDLPSWLGNCLQIAVATAPGERYADAETFARALENGLVRGDMKANGRRPWRLHISPLRWWQAATLLFAAWTLFLLLSRL
ncbi:MAG: protein kinase [Rhizomicrobium sp.]